MRLRIVWMLCLVLLAAMQGCCTTKSDTAASAEPQTAVPTQKVTLMERLNDWDHWVRDHLW